MRTLKLAPNGDGTYRETEPVTLPGVGLGGQDITAEPDVAWVRTSYSEPREALDECVVCGEEIEDWDLWLCMDGGDCAHFGCAEVAE